jgi:hypothetical protein
LFRLFLEELLKMDILVLEKAPEELKLMGMIVLILGILPGDLAILVAQPLFI